VACQTPVDSATCAACSARATAPTLPPLGIQADATVTAEEFADIAELLKHPPRATAGLRAALARAGGAGDSTDYGQDMITLMPMDASARAVQARMVATAGTPAHLACGCYWSRRPDGHDVLVRCDRHRDAALDRAGAGDSTGDRAGGPKKIKKGVD
jgi:hypothetical protein